MKLRLLHAASQAANNSMLESAKSIAECSNECGVSVDGHVQKRVGSARLRKLKKNVQKGLGGKGKLTDKFIEHTSKLFWNCNWSNVGNLSNMQTAVIAAFFIVAPPTKTHAWTMPFWIRYMV
ncbi:hypothetical protein TNCV_2432441 [Trichonephila clavipes]|nr:hypothetical protein TNCV_2432441 [Trichonephila clavipes]